MSYKRGSANKRSERCFVTKYIDGIEVNSIATV